MISEDILFSTVYDLSKLIRRKKLSPLRLTEAYLDRIEKVDHKLRAFVTVTSALAREQAVQAEREINAGIHRGPLHGVPFVVKDLFAVKGYPTTWGAVPYGSQRIDVDATVIRKLHDAGAVLLGKCAMTELAGGPPKASATGACRTPWDLSRWSGGSSSGPASAVAAGLAPFGLGTETWGSIMTPSSFCGITGLRPTFGRVSRYGAMALSWTMDKIGVLGRSARDCATIFQAIAGPDTEDPSTVGRPFKASFTGTKSKAASLRLAYVQEDYQRWGETDVAEAFTEALEVFRSVGFKPVPVALPDYPYEEIAETIIAAEQASAFESLVRDGLAGQIIDADRRGELLGGNLIRAVDYLRCQRVRTRIFSDMAKLFVDHDIVLGSSTLQCAPPVDADMGQIFPGGNIIEAAENLVGLPAVSVPCGFNGKKLPIGLKIIGRTFAESDILELAHMYQSATGWHEKRPKI